VWSLKKWGCKVYKAYDVGVAGLHRTFEALKEMLSNDVDVIIAIAGREGCSSVDNSQPCRRPSNRCSNFSRVWIWRGRVGCTASDASSMSTRLSRCKHRFWSGGGGS
jgi:hypothetical protein